MKKIDWAGVARSLDLDIPPQNVEAVAPVLDSLVDSFRPLLAQLDPVRNA
jgi:hypothetical protein